MTSLKSRTPEDRRTPKDRPIPKDPPTLEDRRTPRDRRVPEDRPTPEDRRTPWNRRGFIKTTAAVGLAGLPGARALGLDAEADAGDASVAPQAAGSAQSPRIATDSQAYDDPLGVRASFPVTRELAYLNTASSGPLPIPVRDALRAYAEEKSLYHNPASRGAAETGARAGFARLFGADEDEVALLYATSGAENVVASALELGPGDNVVVDELHFVTTFVLYRELERRKGVELRIVPAADGAVSADDFAARTDDRTRLISVAWVSNRNGFRHDLPALADLAHAHGGYLYADAIQAFGTFPANLHDEKVDFACGNGYKWLFADFGCAPFYVRREHLEWMTPDRWGHRQVAEELPGRRYRMRTDARKFQYANAAYGPATAMDAALRFLGEVELDRIAAHTHALAGELRERAAALGMKLFTPPANPSPIVSFHHGMDPETLAKALADADVSVTFQEDGKLLRAAVAMFNNRSDVDRLLDVLAGLA